MKNAKKILAFMIVFAVISGMLAGCAQSSGSENAVNDKTYKLSYQCSWASSALLKYASDLSAAIVSCSGGRVTMDCMPANSVVSSVDLLDAVASRTLDCAQTAATYFPDDSLGILSTLPIGMSFDEYMGWYISGEGQQILDEVMMEINPNVVAIPCGIVDSEILYHSIVPISKLDDIKGLKIRGVSDWAAIQTKLGAAVVNIDGGECYEALSRGTIDACEYSGPSANWSAGFHEVCPYLTVPGIHQSTATYLLLINRGVWEGLDEQIQNIIKLACTAMMAKIWSDDRVASAEAWNRYKELEAQGKLTIYRLSDEDIATIESEARKHFEEKSANNPLFAKIYNSQVAYTELVRSWSEAVAWN